MSDNSVKKVQFGSTMNDEPGTSHDTSKPAKLRKVDSVLELS